MTEGATPMPQRNEAARKVRDLVSDSMRRRGWVEQAIEHAGQMVDAALAEERRPYVEALETITVEINGRRMYRTRNGVPMEMPAKFDRIVRAALERSR